MPRRKKRKIQPKSAWAIYLRTSSEEAQNPENSHRRQRHAIENSLFERMNIPVFREYIDNLSGRYADNRPRYQQMLEDARAGHFSHVAVENAERFGRNDTEALVAIDELDNLGVAVRFADYPELDPIDPDDRILVSLSFTLARRESIKLGQRVKGGLHAKMRAGGFVGKAPDGYINCEEKSDQLDKSKGGRYMRWIEPDPKQFKVWRRAWDLLLTDQYTLAQICEDLHNHGYTFRTGRAFVKVRADGKNRTAANGLSRVFKNWFYAGWVVSERAKIPPKTVPGQWKPLVTTEEFERGLAILASRQKHRASGKCRHDYFLRGLVYVRLDSGRLVRLTSSTSNASRPGGGTSYYCITSSDINIQCHIVDDQVGPELMKVQVEPELVPKMREAFTEELEHTLDRMAPSKQANLERKLKEIDDEEARALRLYTTGKISEKIWDNMWIEWQNRRRSLRHALDSIETQNQIHIANLDSALTIIAKIGILYSKLQRDSQKKLLREMVKRVVVNSDGKILWLELHPPFSYLDELRNKMMGCSNTSEGKTKTSSKTGQCSSYFSLGSPYGTRTRVSTLKGWHPGPLDEGTNTTI